MIHALLLQAPYNYGTPTDPNAFAAATGASLLVSLIFFIVILAFVVLQLICYYHLVVTDSVYFKEGIYDKKKWFWIFLLCPLTILILIGILVVPAAYLYYIFAVRSDVERRKAQANSTQNQINQVAQSHDVNL